MRAFGLVERGGSGGPSKVRVTTRGLRRLLYYIAPLSLVLASFASPSANAGSWSSPPDDIDPQTSYDDWSPRLATDLDGTTWVVWMGVDSIEGDEEVLFARWNGSSWDAPHRINPPNQTPDRFPEIAVARDGTLWCLWAAETSEPGKYAGLTSRWTGNNWSWPDTVWVGGERHDHYRVTPAGAGEAWFVRAGAQGSSWDIHLYHFVQGIVQSVFDYGSLDSDEVHPSVTVDADGIPWAVWEQVPLLSPGQARLQFTRYLSGSWEDPQTIPNPYGLVYSYVQAGPDNVKWILCLASDPVNGYRGEAVWALRWEGQEWSTPLRISEPVTSNDTTQTFLSVSRNPRSYTRVVWGKTNIFGTTRLDPLTSAWTGTKWTEPELVGSPADSALIMHPDIVASGPNTVWVAYMRRALPDPTWHVYSTHFVDFTTSATSVDFDVREAAGGAEITWNLHGIRQVSAVRVVGAPGIYPPSAARPPEGGRIVFEATVGAESPGNVRDPVSAADVSYWLDIQLSSGEVKWEGPRTLHLGPLRTSALLGALPNPTNGTVMIRGRIGVASSPLVRIFDANGRLIRTLTPRASGVSGEFSLLWDGLTDEGRPAASGIYLVRLGMAGPAASIGLRVVLVR